MPLTPSPDMNINNIERRTELRDAYFHAAVAMLEEARLVDPFSKDADGIVRVVEDAWDHWGGPSLRGLSG